MQILTNGTLFINVIVILMIIIAIAFGYMNGFLWQVIRIVGLIATVILSFVLAPGLADLIKVVPVDWVPFKDTSLAEVFYSKINTLIWYLIVFILGMIITLILKPIFKAVTEIKIIKWLDKSLGIILSLIPTTIVIMLITYLLSSAIFSNGAEIIDNSILKYTKIISSKVSSVVDETLKENTAIQKLINSPLEMDENDLTFIIDWLKNAQVDSETIKTFLLEHGVDANKINELIQKEE